ncbi:hypothetical protein J6590_083657 [Homalodisca vitripennis]|nr:hypothetical protein J6590_083657 [Homalodisca vitripennis]
MRKQYLQCYDSTFYNFAARGKRNPLPPPPTNLRSSSGGDYIRCGLSLTRTAVSQSDKVDFVLDMSATLTRDRVKVTSTIVGEFIMIYTSLLEPRLLHRSLITRHRLHTDLHIVTEAETPSQIANYTPPAAHRSLITSHRPHTDLHIVTGAETPSQIANYTPPAAHRSTHPTGRTHIYTSLLEPRPLHRSLITRHRPHTDLHIVTGAETPSQIANYNSTGCTQIYTSLLERTSHTDRHIVTEAESPSQIANYPPPAAHRSTNRYWSGIDISLLERSPFHRSLIARHRRTQIDTSLLERSVNHRSLITRHRLHKDRHIVTGAEPLSQIANCPPPSHTDRHIVIGAECQSQIANYPQPAAYSSTHRYWSGVSITDR